MTRNNLDGSQLNSVELGMFMSFCSLLHSFINYIFDSMTFDDILVKLRQKKKHNRKLVSGISEHYEQCEQHIK